MEIYLIRHPEVAVEPGICYGQSDVELSGEALNAAIKKITSAIPDCSDLIFYSSDLIRCKTLAESLSSTQVFFSAEIRELNFGKWELKNWNELPPEDLKIWMDDFVNQNCHGGESYLDLYSRSVSFWKELIKKNLKRVAVITHGGVIRSVLCYVLNVSLKHSFKFKIDYSGISLIKINDNNEIIEFINK